MKKSLSILLSLLLFSAVYAQDSIHVSFAEWTFDNWYGGGVIPAGQLTNKPVPADRGTLASTAKIGTEQMFGGGSVSRIWDVPTSGGYVRCSKNWTSGSTELYYMISGINTLGASSVSLTSSHATSSSSQPYSMKVQYRTSSNGMWKDLTGPFSVTDVTESGISRKQVNNVKLPGECNNAPYLDIRWLCTTFPSSSSTQFRLDNIYLIANVENPDPTADKTPLVAAQALIESDWAIPSWTQFLTARKAATDAPITANLTALSTVMDGMLKKEMPYCINASINGDPATNMGFTWFTNSGISEGQVQLVGKENATALDFEIPFQTVNATPTNFSNVNYVVLANDPTFTANLAANCKRSYVSHKSLVTGLSPNTLYSYRVGKSDSWSSIRTFRTAKNTKEEFSFIYITDTQANSTDNFNCSSDALSEAYKKATNPLFVLMTGDLVESQGSSNSEWEYEQIFERMQNIWSKLPLVATIGNHDASTTNNFYYHTNNDLSFNQTSSVKTTLNGTVYSFVAGDALFMIVNHEDVTKTGYLAALGSWMTDQVNAHPNVRWRIVGVHSGLFSGGSHQADATNVTLRNALLPYYKSLKIDLALQGHDHVYYAIGPVDNATKTVVPGAVQKVGSAPIMVQSNMNGKTGGIFDVTQGTLYFSNNSASRKKYSPTSQSSMISDASITGVSNYWGLFTGRFGQTGEPTFSNIRVTSDTIFIATYALNNSGTTYLFDQIKITKEHTTRVKQVENDNAHVVVDSDKNTIKVHGMEPHRIDLYNMKGQLVAVNRYADFLSTTALNRGIYIVRIYGKDGVYNKKILI